VCIRLTNCWPRRGCRRAFTSEAVTKAFKKIRVCTRIPTAVTRFPRISLKRGNRCNGGRRVRGRGVRLFLIGFPKSGTSTIHAALERSGYRSGHWRCTRGFVGQIIYENHLSGRDPLHSLETFDAITQADVCLPLIGVNYWPNLDFNILGSILRRYPDCLFVLNWRDPALTASSIARWGDLQQRLTISDIPGLPRGFGADVSHLVRWIEGHRQAARVFFKGANFLELDIAAPDAADRLGSALGTPLVWWGRANENPAEDSSKIGEAALPAATTTSTAASPSSHPAAKRSPASS